MHLTRTIWPVGHGAFYTEIFEGIQREFVAVYDCGGSYRRVGNGTFTAIESCVNGFLKRIGDNRVIDIAFVSHFHRDHINGLQILINTGRVKQLVVPHLHKANYLEAFVYNAITGDANNVDIDSDIQRLLINVVNRNVEGTITTVEPQIEENGGRQLDPVVYDGQLNRESIQSGTPILVPLHVIEGGKTIEWIYIPVDIDCDQAKVTSLKDKIEAKANALGKTILDAHGNPDFDQVGSVLVEIGITELKKIYAEVFDAQGKKSANHNNYSMPVYSGLRNEDNAEIVDVRIYPPYRWLSWWLYNVGLAFIKDKSIANCLYMGDFKTKTNIVELKRKLGVYYSKARLQQVPHHFSNRGNHDFELYRHSTFAFGNVDGDNDESFSPLVHNEIIDQGCMPVIVTEGGELVFYYRIY